MKVINISVNEYKKPIKFKKIAKITISKMGINISNKKKIFKYLSINLLYLYLYI